MAVGCVGIGFCATTQDAVVIVPSEPAIELTESLKALFTTTAAALKGAARCVFMARSLQELGRGGQSVEVRLPGLGKWPVDIRHTPAKPSTG